MDLERKINIIGEIDDTSYAEFVEQLDDLESIIDDDITIELNSCGGDAISALAFYDRIRLSKNNITIYVLGAAQSAAVVILAAGDKRIMSKNAWVMVHEDTIVLPEDARVSDVEKNAQVSRRLEDQWNKILEQETGTSAETWEQLHAEETYLDANECLKLGLVDKII